MIDHTKDYYSILGVEKTASKDDIKKSYRTLARKHHPDRGGDTTKFQEIEEANRILSNDDSRQEYDMLRANGGPRQFHFRTGGTGPFADIFGDDTMSYFEEILRNHHRQQQPRYRTKIFISLEDVYHGTSRVIVLNLSDGTHKQISVTVPPGIHNSSVLRLNHTINNQQLIIEVQVIVMDHKEFTRNDSHLILKQSINCFEAILGTKVNITTLDNKTLSVKIPAGTQPGQTISLKNKGLPVLNSNNVYGDIYLIINVIIPQHLTENQKELVEQLIQNQ